MSAARYRSAALLLSGAALLAGCERHFFQSSGSVASDGGALAAWSRPVQGCSPDPLDGLSATSTATLFTLYWDNPVDRDYFIKHPPRPKPNQLQQLEVSRTPTGLTGLLKTTKIEPGTVLDSIVCSTFKATASPGKPVIVGGRPTVDGTLALDCRVAGSHLTASVRFTGCEF